MDYDLSVVKEFIDKGPVDPEQIDYRENVKKDVSDLQQTEYVKNTAEKYINEKAAEKEKLKSQKEKAKLFQDKKGLSDLITTNNKI